MSVLDAGDLRRAQTRIAHEIVERNRGADDVVLVGLYTRGLAIARRLADRHRRVRGPRRPGRRPRRLLLPRRHRPPAGARRSAPPRSPSTSPGKVVVLVDDVLYTGRTVRAALDALTELGRPRRSSSRCSSTAATGSCRSAPTSSARTCPPASAKTCASAWPRSTAAPTPSSSGATATEAASASEEVSGVKHLLVDRRPRPRASLERAPRPLRARSSRSPSATSRRSRRSRGKVVVSLFYEDSTRTRISFETAAKRLSCDVMTFSRRARRR